jgi:hypothetical protein
VALLSPHPPLPPPLPPRRRLAARTRQMRNGSVSFLASSQSCRASSQSCLAPALPPSLAWLRCCRLLVPRAASLSSMPVHAYMSRFLRRALALSSVLQHARTPRTHTFKTTQDKQRLQQLIRHFFFEIQREGGGGDANTAAARAVERARAWIAENGNSAPLPSSS